MTMRRCSFLLLLLVIPLAFAQGGVDAAGGQITGVNFSIDQPLDHWHFFYGNAGANATSLLNYTGNSNNSSLITLSSTHGLYFISDTPMPFGGTYRAPNLTEFDAHFGIPGIESSSLLFNDTSDFILSTTTGTAAGVLPLPTLYIPGTNDSHAFREGIMQSGSSFVFVVPISGALGADGQAYDYQFFLPFDFNSSQSFYTFAVVIPPPPASGSGAQPLNYDWNYADGSLNFNTHPGATITLTDELGRTYTFTADNAGQMIATLPPGEYTMQVTEPGFIGMTDTLYIPAGAQGNTPTEPGQPAPPAAGTVTITSTPEGNVLCFGSDCYLQEAGSSESLQALSELSCTGSICRLVGANQTYFIQKHNLTRTTAAGARGAARTSPPLNFNNMLKSLGDGLTSQFGSTSSGGSSIFIAFALVALAGGAVLLYFRKGRGQKFGGYD